MKVAIVLILVSVGLAQAAEAQHRSSTVKPLSDSIRLRIERALDPGVIVSDPACADGIPLPTTSEERGVWSGAAEIALPPTAAVCAQQEAKATAKGKSVQVLSGRAEDIQGGREVGVHVAKTAESKVIALGTGHACSAINTVGQGC